MPIYPAPDVLNHHAIFKCWCHIIFPFKFLWFTLPLQFLRSTYKISSFTLRCIMHVGLNGNIQVTQEWQDQTLK